MLSKAYKDYIKSDKWRKKRQEAFAIHGRRCKACGKANKIMNVHHLTYERLGRESAVHDLIILCIPCHKSITKIYRSNRRRGLRRVTMEYVTAKRKALAKNR